MKEEVESLLAMLERDHKPNRGVFAELCRTWLAVHAAPVATFEVDQTHDHRGLHLRDADPEVLLLQGRRIRLVPDCGSGE